MESALDSATGRTADGAGARDVVSIACRGKAAGTVDGTEVIAKGIEAGVIEDFSVATRAIASGAASRANAGAPDG